MKSIYQKALGENFKRLHPKLQEKFGLTSTGGKAAISHGIMDEITGGLPFLRPLFRLGTGRRMVFPERGCNISFMLENYAYRDSYGRECIIWARTFDFGKKKRHFDAVMVYSEQKERIIDYFGSHQDFVSDLEFTVLDDGGLRIISKEQRLLPGDLAIPLPVFLRAEATVTERFLDETNEFFIHVQVRNPIVGTLFEYQGTFRTEYVHVLPEEIPDRVIPVKERKRE